jgi:predicted nuclease with TOPRIM domain
MSQQTPATEVWKPSMIELQKENQALVAENRELRARVATLEQRLRIESEATRLMNDTLAATRKVLVDAKERYERGLMK